MKKITLVPPMAVLALGILTGASGTAQAAGCYYQLSQDGRGLVSGIQGYGHAAKLENACNRARRECNRRFERARKNGQLPRGGPRDFRCIRTTAG